MNKKKSSPEKEMPQQTGWEQEGYYAFDQAIKVAYRYRFLLLSMIISGGLLGAYVGRFKRPPVYRTRIPVFVERQWFDTSENPSAKIRAFLDRVDVKETLDRLPAKQKLVKADLLGRPQIELIEEQKNWFLQFYFLQEDVALVHSYTLAKAIENKAKQINQDIDSATEEAAQTNFKNEVISTNVKRNFLEVVKEQKKEEANIQIEFYKIQNEIAKKANILPLKKPFAEEGKWHYDDLLVIFATQPSLFTPDERQRILDQYSELSARLEFIREKYRRPVDILKEQLYEHVRTVINTSTRKFIRALVPVVDDIAFRAVVSDGSYQKYHSRIGLFICAGIILGSVLGLSLLCILGLFKRSR